MVGMQAAMIDIFVSTLVGVSIIDAPALDSVHTGPRCSHLSKSLLAGQHLSGCMQLVLSE